MLRAGRGAFGCRIGPFVCLHRTPRSLENLSSHNCRYILYNELLPAYVSLVWSTKFWKFCQVRNTLLQIVVIQFTAEQNDVKVAKAREIGGCEAICRRLGLIGTGRRRQILHPSSWPRIDIASLPIGGGHDLAADGGVDRCWVRAVDASSTLSIHGLQQKAFTRRIRTGKFAFDIARQRAVEVAIQGEPNS